jgi:CBS domain-containing protein
MKVRELMATDVRACFPDDTLNRAAQLMWENDCGVVPVVDEEMRVVGVITDRDVCMAAYTQGVQLVDSSVGRAMSPGAYTCAPTDDLKTAERTMRERRVRRLPVVDGDGKLVGMLSLHDIVREAERERVSKTRKRQIQNAEVVETLGAICALKTTRPPL